MPVSSLLCEGEQNGPDGRLLRSILRGVRLEVIPSGGKDGLPNAILAWRKGHPNVCAFRDSDFPREPEKWAPHDPSRALEWRVKRQDGHHLIGWMWCRKEIENYFVDPDLLKRVFQWSDTQNADYRAALDNIVDDLACTTAARMALTACAPKRNRVQTAMPLCGTADEMKRKLSKIAEEYESDVCLDEHRLHDTFDALLPECQSGGRFRVHALDVFAGKTSSTKCSKHREFRTN